MKVVTILTLMLALVACKHEAQDANLANQDLSGTWLLTEYKSTYDKATNALIGTSAVEHTIVIEDDPGLGVLYWDCWKVTGVGSVATKTDTILYIDSGTVAFESIGTNVMETAEETGIEYVSLPGFVFSRYHRLEKLTSAVDVDKGHFILNGPISISESDTVCVWHVDYGDARNVYELVIPYDNDQLSMRIEFDSEPLLGVHNYTPSAGAAELTSFDVISNSANFWSVVGSNTLYPNPATITITKSTDSHLAGTFSFVGQDAEDYTGEFSMDKVP